MKGCKDVYDSFNEYCEPEVMDGRTSTRQKGTACRWAFRHQL